MLGAKAERGSTMLATMFAVFAGVSFVLLYVNLTRYVAAKGAVQEAARKAARCISATDSPCVRVEAESPQPLKEWYGFRAGSFIDLYGHKASYSLSMPQTEYTLSLPSYELRSERHVIEWPEYQLPVTRYVGLLNSWAILRADVVVLFTPESGGEVFRCRLPDHAEIPWGLDFSKPQSYLNDKWCEGVGPREAAVDPQCAELADPAKKFVRYVDPNWSSSCGVQLPGAPETVDEQPRNPQPWLLLGGDPLCDDELARLPKLNQPLPDTPPWGTAGIGDTERPFLMTVERQYLVIEVVSCNPQQTLSQLEQHLTTRSTERLEQIAEIEAIAKYFTTTEKITAPRFDPIDFNNHPTESDATLGLNSLFIQPGNSLGQPLSLIIPPVYDWTFFKWERFPDRNPQDPDADRTFLYRKVCGWRTWDDALARGWTGLHNSTLLPALLRVAGMHGSCGAVTASQPRPSFACGNREYREASGELESCQGWQERLRELQRTYDSNIAKIEFLNSRLGTTQIADLPTGEDFSSEVKAVWSANLVDKAWERVWQARDPQGQTVSDAYQRPVKNFVVHRTELQRVDQAHEGPSPEQWLTTVQQADSMASSRLGWQHLLENLAVDASISKRSVEPLEFSSLEPLAIATEFDLDLSQVEWFRPTGNSAQRYDYNFDCIPDTTCVEASDAADQSSLEQRLRQRVAVEFNEPRAVDPKFRVAVDRQVEGHLSYLGRLPETAVPSLRTALPKCAPLLTSCTSQKLDGEPQFVAVSDSLPPRCSKGEFIDCFTLPNFAQIPTEPKVQMQEDLARFAGHREISRIFPDAALASRCDAASCSEITIDLSEAGMVNIDVSYRLPISFPLDAVLGTDAVEVRSHTVEHIELDLLR